MKYGKTYQFRWGEFTPRWGLCLEYSTGSCAYESRHPYFHITPIFGNLFLKLPWVHYYDPGGYDSKQWGFSLYERQIFLRAGLKYVLLDLPWAWKHISHEVETPDGWAPYAASYDTEKEPDGRIEAAHDYTYVLEDGTIQNRTATIYVERREWRWKWFSWLGAPKKISTNLDVSFSDEVGEETGSWKGGCTGCGYDILPDETPYQCLRRMEQERKF